MVYQATGVESANAQAPRPVNWQAGRRAPLSRPPRGRASGGFVRGPGRGLRHPAWPGSAGDRVLAGSSPVSPRPSPASVASSRNALERERAQVAAQYWPVTGLVMKDVPGMRARLGIGLRFEEAFGIFTSCGPGVNGGGLRYQVSVILMASGGRYEDLGPPLGQAARVLEKALNGVGWGPFTVTQGVTVAAWHDGVSASFDNDPATTETDTSMATALVYSLAGACVPVPSAGGDAGDSGTGNGGGPPNGAGPDGGGEAGDGPDAGPPPGDVSAGDGLPPVRDSYGLGPARLAPLVFPASAPAG
jgi:hypothetical protein